MKKELSLALLGVLVVMIACTSIQAANDVPRISKDELKAKLGSSDMVLIDVRTKNDWESSTGKIRGAVRRDPLDVDSWSGTLPKDKEIILYCA